MSPLSRQPNAKTPTHIKHWTRVAGSAAGTFVICLLFSLVMVYHFVVPLNAVLSSDGKVWNDPAHSIWSLWLVNENITHGHSPYHTDLIFYPVGANLAHHTLSPGFFPVTFLVQKLSGNDAMYPVYAYRIIVWLCFTLLLYFTYLLLRELEFTRFAASIGSIAFAFADFFYEHSPHLSLLAGFFIPLAGFLFLRLYRKPGFKRLITAGLSVGLAIYFTELVLYIVLGLGLILVAALLIRDERSVLREKFRQLGAGKLLLTCGLTLAVMTPFLVNYFASNVKKPPAMESSNYSANLPGFVIPEPHRTPLYGRTFAALSARMTEGSDSRETFAGFPILLFAIIALVCRRPADRNDLDTQDCLNYFRRRRKMTYAATAVGLVFFLLSLGPTLKVFRTDTGFPLPYSLLMKVPPFDLGRTPVRFVMMGIFFFTIVAGAGITCAEAAVVERWGRRWATGLLLVVLAWTVAESYWPFPRQPPFSPPAELALISEGPVLNLPASRFDGYAALLQVFHHQPIATGYISRFSAQQISHVDNLADLADQDSDEACAGLVKLGIRNIILDPVPLSEAPYELSHCPLKVIDLRRRDSTYAAYETGTLINFATPEADRFLGYGWSAAEPFGRWTERRKAIIAFSIAKPGPMNLRLWPAPFLGAGRLEQQQLIVKINDQVVANLIVNRREVMGFDIPLTAGVRGGNNVLTLELPDARSPQSLGLSDDTRRLGIMVAWMAITKDEG